MSAAAGPFTACPHCRAVFRVPAAALRAAGGRVRCGVCRGAFDALDTLADGPGEALALLPPGDGGGEPTAALPRLTNDAALAPRFPFPEPARPPRRARWWLVAALALAAALLLQAVVLQPATMRRWLPAPLIDTACRWLPCRPLPASTAGVRLIGRDVREHPLYAGALLVNAALRNDAPQPRMVPAIELSLYDRRGALVAVGRFPPQAWLDSHRIGSLAPGEVLFATLEVAGPVADAAGFELSLSRAR